MENALELTNPSSCNSSEGFYTMNDDLREKLAAALGVATNPICEVQRLYNDHKKYLSGKVIKTPLPEQVHLLDDNFPYWIHLENPDPTRPEEWISAKSNIVVAQLEAGTFDQSGFRYEQGRSRALLNIPVLLKNPNCIHVNLRHHAYRGGGGIKGNHMYVECHGKRTRKVGFTLYDQVIDKVVLVSSFWTYKKWVVDCASNPAVYVRPGSKCDCCGQ
jgi:hypothetical protein